MIVQPTPAGSASPTWMFRARGMEFPQGPLESEVTVTFAVPELEAATGAFPSAVMAVTMAAAMLMALSPEATLTA